MNFKARCDMVVKTYKALLAQTELRDVKNYASINSWNCPRELILFIDVFGVLHFRRPAAIQFNFQIGLHRLHCLPIVYTEGGC